MRSNVEPGWISLGTMRRTGIRRLAVELLAWMVCVSVSGQVPELVGQVIFGESGVSARRIVASGSHLYAAAGTNGMHVFDVGDPARVRQIVRLPPPEGSAFLDVAVSSNLACLAMGSRGLLVVDIGNVAAPVVRGRYPEVLPADPIEARVVSRVYLRDGFTGEAEVVDGDPMAASRFYRAIWNP